MGTSRKSRPTGATPSREDRELPLAEQLALRMPMAICAACPLFERQVLTMRNAMKQWRHYGADDDSAS